MNSLLSLFLYWLFVGHFSLYCYSSDELAVLHSVHNFVGNGVFIFVIFFMNSKYLLIVVNHTRCQKLSIYFLSLIKLKKIKIVIFFSKKMFGLQTCLFIENFP